MAIARDCNSLDYGLRQFESDRPHTNRKLVHKIKSYSTKRSDVLRTTEKSLSKI